MSPQKTCSKCNETKCSNEYYASNRACKECVKKETRLRYKLKLSTPEGLDKERERHRDKYHRLGYLKKYKPTPEMKKLAIDKYKKKYPEKQKAKNKTSNMTRSIGNELHHWNYNLDFYKDVFELNSKDHAKLHRFLEYNEITFTYKTTDGIILDTKEKHEAFIKQLGIEIYN